MGFILTGAPGFPGTDRGGMLGLLPGGGGGAEGAAGVGTGLGAAGVTMAGVALGAGEIFKRFSASLVKQQTNKQKI